MMNKQFQDRKLKVLKDLYKLQRKIESEDPHPESAFDEDSLIVIEEKLEEIFMMWYY